jgi:hypothetical protein
LQAVQADFTEAFYIKGNILRDWVGLGSPDCFDRILKRRPAWPRLNGLAQMAYGTATGRGWRDVAARSTSGRAFLIQPFADGLYRGRRLARRCAENYVHHSAGAAAAAGKPFTPG